MAYVYPIMTGRNRIFVYKIFEKLSTKRHFFVLMRGKPVLLGKKKVEKISDMKVSMYL